MKNRTAQTFPVMSRDLSWLAFNYRVLQEAGNPEVPLLERITFMAIFSSNLDEFFKVRVATMRRLLKLKKKTRSRLTHYHADELELVLDEVSRQQKEFGEIFRQNIQVELQNEGIHLLHFRELTETQRRFARNYFDENLKNLVRPVFLNAAAGHLFLKDQAVYLVSELLPLNALPGSTEAYAILEIPVRQHGSRFVKVPAQENSHCVMFLDDVIRVGLPFLFPGFDVAGTHAIKISRDADLDIKEDVSGSLLTRIARSLKHREEGSPSRLLIDPGMPVNLLELLKQKTGCTTQEVIIGSEYHNFRDFFGFPDFGRTDLTFPPQPPLPHPAFPKKKSVFAAIAGQEVLLHYPYQQYDPVIRFFEEAADDPNVTAISATLYRVAEKSQIAKALIKAARNGKFVTVLVELKARFDEESNISWSRKLEKAGAYVIYGIPGYKVHCKLALITRLEGAVPVNYAYLSTGNFNEKSARVYTDYGFFTTDARFTREADRIFQYFLDKNPAVKFKRLLVAPFNLRRKLNRLINRETAFARQGLPAGIILKLNSLQDPKMVQKLYQASNAGVKISLIVRGICTLIPGKKGFSENITLRSIVDRYLEHPRVYLFYNNGSEKIYLSSADWMTRNLSRRVEIAFPVYDPVLQSQLKADLARQLHDTVKARNTHNVFYRPAPNETAVQAQAETYALLRETTGTI